jgi:hypothetical protein
MIFFAKINLHRFHHNLFRTSSQMTKVEQRSAADSTSVQPAFTPNPFVVGSPFPLSVSGVLHFNCVNIETVTQAEQEASSLAG